MKQRIGLPLLPFIILLAWILLTVFIFLMGGMIDPSEQGSKLASFILTLLQIGGMALIIVLIAVIIVGALQKLVDQAQAAWKAQDKERMRHMWFEIVDAINELPALAPSDRARLGNLLQMRLQSLNLQGVGSRTIDIKELEEDVRKDPNAGNTSPTSERFNWLPF